MDVDCNFCDIYNKNRHMLALTYGPKTNDLFPYKKCPDLNCKNSAMDTDSDNGYRSESESEESIDHNEYDSDTNWDNWDLEPNIKVRKGKCKGTGNGLYRHFKKICISKVHQPICKKVRKKPLKLKDSDVAKLLSQLQIKNK